MTGPNVTVFVPTPQLTVTIERVQDQDQIHLHAGGQGVWQARMLDVLGAQVRLRAPLAGEVGRILHAVLSGDHIDVNEPAVHGNNGAYVHDRRSGTREELALMHASPLDRHQIDGLYGNVLVDGLESDAVVIGGPDEPGTIPVDLYTRLASDLRANGRPVVVDLTGEPLEAVLKAGVTALKVSGEALGLDGSTVQPAAEAARDLQRLGADQVLLTPGRRPDGGSHRRPVLGGRSTEVRRGRSERSWRLLHGGIHAGTGST